jgi:hypothetical protein
LSLDDSLLNVLAWPALRNLARRFGLHDKGRAGFLFRRAQRRAEGIHSRLRRVLLRADDNLGTLLAFSGEME